MSSEIITNSRSQGDVRFCNETSGVFSRGLRISLAAGAGAFVVVIHISMHLTGHGFHHGH